jgi:hypothetical protein
MAWNIDLVGLLRKPRSLERSRPRRKCFPQLTEQLEALEGRVLLSSYVVTSLGDTAGALTPAGPGKFNASTLRAAITAANSHAGEDTISFASGVAGVIQLGRALPVLSDDVRIFGPGQSELSLQRSTSATSGFSILAVGGGVRVRLSGLTLSKGRGTADGVKRYGGGIVIAGFLIVRNCTISGNSAIGKSVPAGAASGVLPGEGRGGGIYNTGVLGMEHCTISGNVARGGDFFPNNGGDAFGGGIYCTSCVSLIHCTLADNRALGGVGGVWYDYDPWMSWGGEASGGAIANNGSLQIIGSTLSHNVARGGPGGDFPPAFSHGGAVFNGERAYASVDDSTIADNRAMMGAGFSNYATLDLLRCRIIGGKSLDGGGIYNTYGNVTIRDSLLKDNNADGLGGAIYTRGSGDSYGIAIVTITNSNFRGNHAGDSGGAIYNELSNLTATGCQFTGNWSRDPQPS